MAIPTIREQDEEVLATLPLSELNGEIERCVYGYTNGGTSQGRKAFFKRLVMLESIREKVHGAPSEKRAFRAR